MGKQRAPINLAANRGSPVRPQEGGTLAEAIHGYAQLISRELRSLVESSISSDDAQYGGVVSVPEVQVITVRTERAGGHVRQQQHRSFPTNSSREHFARLRAFYEQYAHRRTPT